MGNKVYIGDKLVNSPLNLSIGDLGYTVLEYIESDGTQYIDTEWSGNYIGEIDVQGVSTTDTTSIIVSTTNGDAAGWFGFNNGTSAVYSVGGTGVSNISYNVRKKIHIDTLGYGTNNRTITYYFMDDTGTVYTRNATNSGTATNLTLFSNLSLVYSSSARIYYCRIWDKASGTLVRDMIPVLDYNGIPCMWDRVENKPYYNQGTGEFKYKMWDYQPLDYIESSGTQYIDTGVATTSGTLSISTKFLLNNASTAAIYGNTLTTGFFFGTNANRAVSCNNTNISVGGLSLDVNTIYEIEQKGTSLICNGTTYTVDNQTITSGNAFLFARARNGSPERIINGRIYYCKILDGNTLVRDYIPVITEDGEYALYDKVTNSMYYNKGTGKFVGGWVNNNVSYKIVNYVQATGSQYLNTGVVPKFNTTVEATFNTTADVTGSTTRNYIMCSEAYGRGIQYSYSPKCFYGAGGTFLQDGTLIVDRNKHKIVIAESMFIFDDELIWTGGNEYTTTIPLGVLGGQHSDGTYYATAKLYGCKIYESNELVRNYYPVLSSNNVAGLYCTVTKTFIGSATSTPLTYG